MRSRGLGSYYNPQQPAPNNRDDGEGDLASVYSSPVESVYYDAQSVYTGDDNLAHVPMIDADKDYEIVVCTFLMSRRHDCI